MRHRRFWFALAGTAFFMLVAHTAQADVFYVDASSLNTVGAASGLPDWFTGDDQTQTTGANDPLKWKFRSNPQGNNGIWEATQSLSQTTADAPLIKTTATGTPTGTYDVYVFYRSQPAPDDWTIRAGLTEGSLALYDRAGTDGGAPGTRAFVGSNPTLTFAPGTQPVEDTGQPLYYAIIGQATVTDGNLSVFVDDLPTAGLGTPVLEQRSWYEGIGYFIDPALVFVDSAMTGLHTIPGTWTDNLAPTSDKNYRVVSSHIVTVDSDFLGAQLRVASGGAVNFTASGADIRSLVVDAGGNLTDSVSGNFYLGDISATTLGTFKTSADLTFNIDAASEFGLDLALDGPGNINFNSGADSVLYLSAADAHDGRIRFNGSGDQVLLVESQAYNILEMNSTGDNKIVYDTKVQISDRGALIFNQPGIIEHKSTLNRLQGPLTLQAHADVTFDVSATYPGDERRMLIAGGNGTISGEVEGSGNITVNGTLSDSHTGGSVTLNEFEIGSTGEPAAVASDTYSGTITANNFINMEVRHHMEDAAFVVNANSRMEMGHQAVPNARSIRLGEITVNNDGVLEIGFEQGPVALNNGYTTGHHAYNLTLQDGDTRDGELAVNDGATLRMQINGTADNQFDRITADGDVALNGMLNVLINPPSTNATANPTHAFAVNDTFDIIEIAGGALTGDYNEDGIVDAADYVAWRRTDIGGAQGYTDWRANFGQTGGGGDAQITGTFDQVTVTDPGGNFAGFAFQVIYSSSLVQLKVVVGGPGSGEAIPEPSTLALACMVLSMLLVGRRRIC